MGTVCPCEGKLSQVGVFTAREWKQLLSSDCRPDVLVMGLVNHHNDFLIKQADER